MFDKKKMFANVTVSSEAKNYGDHLQKKCLFYTWTSFFFFCLGGIYIYMLIAISNYRSLLLS